MSDEPEYELKFSRNAPYDHPLVIEADREVVAELDVRVGPHMDGAENVDMNEGVCTKVFDGHHWQRPEVKMDHEPARRRCALCGKAQKKVERWEDLQR